MLGSSAVWKRPVGVITSRMSPASSSWFTYVEKTPAVHLLDGDPQGSGGHRRHDRVAAADVLSVDHRRAG